MITQRKHASMQWLTTTLALYFRRLLNTAAISAVLLMPGIAAAGLTPWVNIVNVGGQGSLIFVVVSQTVTSDAGCSGTRIVLSPTTYDVDQQKRIYTAALTAISTGKQMQFYLSGCWGAFPSMINVDWWFIQP